MIKLLFVEDDESLRYIVKSALEELIGDYEVINAINGKEGLLIWKEQHPDVIVSDIDMPLMDGFKMVEKIRETDEDTPILFTSALTSPKDVKTGYSLGVNNYIKKPFSPDELHAHIGAILKMKKGAKMREKVNSFNLGRYTLDLSQATLIDNEAGKSQPLTHRQIQLLHFFIENKNTLIKRNVILERFWEKEDDFFASRSLDVFISKLRKLLEKDSTLEIRTIKGVGLMLVIKE